MNKLFILFEDGFAKISAQADISPNSAFEEVSLGFANYPINRLYKKGEIIKIMPEPPIDGERYRFDIDSEVWVWDVEANRNEKSQAINNMCRLMITSGYDSDALGELHTYPSNQTDQLNMSGSVTDSYNPDNAPDWTTPFWCKDQSGTWSFKQHTAAQIRTAGAAGKAHIAACQLKNAQLQAQVALANTAEELAVITW